MQPKEASVLTPFLVAGRRACGERSPRPLLVAYAWSKGPASFSVDATGQEGLRSQATIKPSRRGRLAKLEIRSSETVTSESSN